MPSSPVPRPASDTNDESCTKSKSPAAESPFIGDEVLARSIAFIREAMFAREFSLATADGDVGRIWEMIKIMVFSFAGSSHSKYTYYLLEMITDLELESSHDLRDNLLKCTLVNLSGQEGHWSAGDFVQEYFNRLLEAIVQRKGIEYGDTFIRKTWARNLHHIARLKLSWLDGVGLKRRSSKHRGAKTEAELRILLKLYKECELHSFRSLRRYLPTLSKPGSSPTPIFLDDYQKGVLNLRGGKLQRWAKRTSRTRNLTTHRAQSDSPCEEEEEEDSDSDLEDDNEDNAEPQVLRYTAIVNGELVVDGIDDDDMVQAVDDTETLESDSSDED